ncbi:hypothetical protein ACI48J_06045 [Paenibacillus chitinolyticus]|uniref:hypothetical protein n=1 Tax=Paenibacillus chitinolyticus TaxID=79263 RepID=UPI003863B19E
MKKIIIFIILCVSLLTYFLYENTMYRVVSRSTDAVLSKKSLITIAENNTKVVLATDENGDTHAFLVERGTVIQRVKLPQGNVTDEQVGWQMMGKDTKIIIGAIFNPQIESLEMKGIEKVSYLNYTDKRLFYSFSTTLDVPIFITGFNKDHRIIYSNIP